MKLTLAALGLAGVFAATPVDAGIENYSTTAEELKEGSTHLLYFVEEENDTLFVARTIYRVIIDEEPSEDGTIKLRELPPVNIQWKFNEQFIKEDTEKRREKKKEGHTKKNK